MANPTPDLNTVTLVWRGVLRSGAVPSGSIRVAYDGGVELDPHATYPIPVFPAEWTVSITPTTIGIPDEVTGTPVSTTVGQASFEVPVSNDPDTLGGGATYTIYENFTGGREPYQVFADIAAPGGVITLADKAPNDPEAGIPYGVVTWAAFTDLDDRVQYLEENPGGGGGSGTVTSVNNVAPVSGNVALDLGDFPDIETALDAKADLVGGLVPTAQLPPLAVTAVIVVASEAAMLASGAATGTVAKRTDTGDSYILQTTPASTLGNWVSISTTSAVDSVAGKTGAVSLVVADVGGAQTELDRRRIAVYWTGSAWPAVGTVPSGTAVDFYSLDDPAATPPPLTRGNDEWHRGF